MIIIRMMILAGLFALSSCCKPLMSETLPVTLISQETSMWCWAASGEMTAEYIAGGNVQQCVEANARFGRTDCCNSPTPTACIEGGWPDGLYASAGLAWDAGAVLAPLGARASVCADLDRLLRELTAELRAGDHVLIMSNGSFGGIHQKLLTALAAR